MPLDSAVSTRLADWRDKLIDLSRANRLLNYNPARASAVRMVEEDPREIADLILASKTLGFDAQVEDAEPLPEGEFRSGDGRLQTALNEDKLRKVLTRLYRESRASIEEQGFNTLYLALGMLSFTTPEDPAGFRAPLLLLPVEILRPGARAPFRLKAYDDEPQVNPALVLKLTSDHGIDLRLPPEEEPLTYSAVVEAFRPALSVLNDASIDDTLFLGLFSFAKIPLYHDLLEHEETIGEHAIAASLATGRALDQGESTLPLPAEVEARLEGRPAVQILDADSSQQAAIVAARDGVSFVLQGPPGTGKSQTIANIISEALAAGRSVLFVSEKMAALEVVQRRLEQAGLGAFCLELHSRKANKREVVRSFERAWAQWSAAAGNEEGRLAELAELRVLLQDYVDALHEPVGAAEFTAFEILGHAARYRAVPEVPFAVDDPLAMDRRALKDVEQRLRSLTPLLASVEPTDAHPWRAARRSGLGVSTLEDARRAINRLLGAIDDHAAAATALFMHLGQDAPQDMAVVGEAVEAADVLLRTTRPPAAWFEAKDWLGGSARVRRAVEQGAKLEAAREALLARFQPAILELDPADLRRRARPGGFILGWWRRRGLTKELEGYLSGGNAVDLRDDVPALEEAARLRSEVGEADAALLEAFGAVYEGPTGTFAPLAAHLAFLDDLRGAWPAKLDVTDAVRSLLAGEGLDALTSALETLRATGSEHEARRAELTELLTLDEDAYGGATASFTRRREIAETWQERLNDLPAWLAWQGAREEAVGEGLGAYLDAFEERGHTSGHLLDAWFRTWYAQAADAVLADSDVLRAFDGRAHDGHVERFRDLDRQQIEAARRRVAGRLRAAVPHPNVRSVGDSEVGLLKRELKKQRRHLPVRSLLARIPQLQRLLKPCLMMSPLSVATYLPPGRELFDLVVFDEASQICTEDGVGAIARGKQVIVCGDSKQLPPTRFFERRIEDSDDAPEDAITDMPSILDECQAGPLPAIPLRWHYRSRDESLITFSNRHFYEDSLVTFPNAARDAVDLGISFVHVADGVYHPGPRASRSNPIEAGVVADKVFDILRERPEDTIGVVTFSTTQRDEVLDAIDARRVDGDPFADRFDGDGVEPVFVKNLEAVQGDERDVILFSIGYGPDPEGAVRLNFGPLNKDGGDRRLNVAVTRARKQVIVHSSLLPEQIDTERAKGRGAKLLRDYLETARRGMETAPVEEAAATPSPLVESLRRSLVDRGFAVDVAVGNSDFKVDLAVRDPEQADRYLLAILCDGERYAGAATARDRERTRCEVLERLGWRVHRVWAPDWVRAPGRELDRLASAVEAAASATEAPVVAAPEVVEADAPTSIDLDAEVDLPGVVDYEPENLRLRGPAAEYHVVPIARVTKALGAVVRKESPVHVDQAVRRVAAAWGITRTTSKVTDRFEEALAALVAAGEADRRGDFVYASGADDAAVRRAAGGVQRDVDEIAPEELGACVLLVVDAYLGIDRDALVKEVSRAFGWQRLGEKLSAALDPVVASLVAEGVLVDEDGRIRRAPVEVPPADEPDEPVES